MGHQWTDVNPAIRDPDSVQPWNARDIDQDARRALAAFDLKQQVGPAGDNACLRCMLSEQRHGLVEVGRRAVALPHDLYLPGSAI